MTDARGNDPLGDENGIKELITKARAAQSKIEKWPQDRIDELVSAAGWHVYKEDNARRLSDLAVEETKMGVSSDHFVRHRKRILGTLRDMAGVKTAGLIYEDPALGIQKIAKPVGVVGAITPATGPTSAVAAIALSTLKTRNAVIFCPNPAAKNAVRDTVEIMRDGLLKVGAPLDLLQTVVGPTRESAACLMSAVDLIVAAGGQGTVRRAYTSGTPAYGAGVGNAVVVVDETADLSCAVSKIVDGKAFDYGTSCSSESCLLVAKESWLPMLAELRKKQVHVCDEQEASRLEQAMWNRAGDLNRLAVGRSPKEIARLSGIEVPHGTRALAIVCNESDLSGPRGGEKLSPIISMWRFSTFAEAIDLTKKLTSFFGPGHSCGIYTKDDGRVERLGQEINVSRIMINQSTGFGNTGNFHNGMPFTVILSCGTWGGSTTTDNINWKNLLNYTWLSRPVERDEPVPEDFFLQFMDRGIA